MKTYGNHRRVQRYVIEKFLGLTNNKDKENNNDNGNGNGYTNGGVKVGILGRCSSQKQSQDLDRQMDLLRAYAKEHYGVDNPICYKDLGSGLSYTRKNFITLLTQVCNNEWVGGVVLASFKDRVCRYGFELVELIMKTHKCEFIVINKEERDNTDDDMCLDVLNIIQLFANKRSGKRSAFFNTFTLQPEAIERAYVLRKQGNSIDFIVKVLNEENYKMFNGHKIGRKISRWCLDRLLRNGNLTMIEKVLDKEEEEEEEQELNSFAEFVKVHIKITGLDEDKLYTKQIYSAYALFCQSKNLPVCSRRICGPIIKNMAKRVWLVCGLKRVSGLRLV